MIDMPIDIEHSSDYHMVKLHITKAAHLALQSDSDGHPDWVVITAFYQALHWVDAYLAMKQCDANSHGERRRAIRKDEDLKPIKKYYKRLYDASIFARYEAKTYKCVPNEVEALVDVDLASIVKHISQLIGEPQT